MTARVITVFAKEEGYDYQQMPQREYYGPFPNIDLAEHTLLVQDWIQRSDYVWIADLSTEGERKRLFARVESTACIPNGDAVRSSEMLPKSLCPAIG